jgi:hypothetical protein
MVAAAMIPTVEGDLFIEVAFIDMTAIVATHVVFFLCLAKVKAEMLRIGVKGCNR